MIKDAHEHLILVKSPKSYLRDGPMIKDALKHLIHIKKLSPTYGVD